MSAAEAIVMICLLAGAAYTLGTAVLPVVEVQAQACPNGKCPG